MRGYTLSPEAEEDLFQIWLYLAEEASLEIADRIESGLYEAFEMLAKNPGLGHKRTDLTKYPVLFFEFFLIPTWSFTSLKLCLKLSLFSMPNGTLSSFFSIVFHDPGVMKPDNSVAFNHPFTHGNKTLVLAGIPA